jgi:GNAT superfamily N-acetyltransferase/DNA-binding protein Fis
MSSASYEIWEERQPRLQLIESEPKPFAEGNSPLEERLARLQMMAHAMLDEVEQIRVSGVSTLEKEIEQGRDYYEVTNRFSAALIRRALRAAGGHQGRAARLLGLKNTTLHSMIQRHNISPSAEYVGTGLRRATEADVPVLIDIARRSWLSAFAGTAPHKVIRAWAEANHEAVWYPEHWPRVTVAEVGGLAVGIVHHRGDEISGLWVRPSEQGCGVGTMLLRAVEQQIRAAKHARAWLGNSSYNTRAHRFFAARGYTSTRRCLDTSPAGAQGEIIVLERGLAPRGASGEPDAGED